MFKNTCMLFLAGVFAVSVLYAPVSTERTHAEHLISDSEVEDQRRAVLIGLVGTLEEHVKLLQMVLIGRLEVQVASLQARIESANR